jgi:hypothetical protein
VGWGCHSCNVCPNGETNHVYLDGPFIPGWQNNTTSLVYVYTSGAYPVSFAWDSTTDRASSDVDVLDGWNNIGLLAINPGYGQ